MTSICGPALVECHPLDDQIVRGPITANVLYLRSCGSR